MKRYSLFCIVFIVSLPLITACLGDEGQKISVANQPGVVINAVDTVKVQMKDITVYADQFGATVNVGDCYLLDYSIDFGLFANADTGRREGLFKVEILNRTPITSHELYTELTDTSVVWPREQILNEIQERYSIIQNQLFLYTKHTVDSVQLINAFDLSYNAEDEPVVDETTNKTVYNLYLRVVKEEGGNRADKPDNIFINAFNISNLLAKYNQTDTLYFRINYARSFDKDTTYITNWSHKIFQYPVKYTSQTQ